jgi:hypothetical protein
MKMIIMRVEIMTKIIFNPYTIQYELIMDNVKAIFETKNEAEFFYINRYIDDEVVNYDEYKIDYHNDLETIGTITIRIKKGS